MINNVTTARISTSITEPLFACVTMNDGSRIMNTTIATISYIINIDIVFTGMHVLAILCAVERMSRRHHHHRREK